jgi:hypothetical protein
MAMRVLDGFIRRRYHRARREATRSSFQTGDLLRRGLSWYADHYGVYLGRYQGQEWVIEVTRDAEQPERAIIRTVPLQLFAEGKPCTVIEHGTADSAVLRARVDDLLGAPGLNYLLLGGDDGWNCESAARYIATGKRRSAQGEAIDMAARVGKASLLAAAGVLGAGLVGMGVTYLKHRRRLPSTPE